MKALPNNLNGRWSLGNCDDFHQKSIFIPLSTAHSIQQESKTENSGRVSQLAKHQKKTHNSKEPKSDYQGMKRASAQSQISQTIFLLILKTIWDLKVCCHLTKIKFALFMGRKISTINEAPVYGSTKKQNCPIVCEKSKTSAPI